MTAPIAGLLPLTDPRRAGGWLLEDVMRSSLAVTVSRLLAMCAWLVVVPVAPAAAQAPATEPAPAAERSPPADAGTPAAPPASEPAAAEQAAPETKPANP